MSKTWEVTLLGKCNFDRKIIVVAPDEEAASDLAEKACKKMIASLEMAEIDIPEIYCEEVTE